MTHLSSDVSESALMGIGHSYLDFLHRAGQANGSIFEDEVPKLFSEFCKKIVNGEIKIHARDELCHYFGKAQEMYGKWKILPLYQLFPSISTRSVTISYVVEVKTSRLIVLAILKLDEQDLISEIFEVDNVLK